MTIALTGATGFVGQAVLDEAERRGAKLRALARREQEPREGVEWIYGDLADRDALARLVDGADAVLHVAGVVNARNAMGFRLGNVAGTEALVQASQTAGANRFVFVSSLAAREPKLSKYGTSKRDAEALVEASGLDWTIVRPPAIYGPRDREILEMFKLARFKVVPMPPSGRTSIIHADDLARLLLVLAADTSESTRHRIFEPDDGREGGWPHARLGRAIGRAVGKSVWVPGVPKSLLNFVARLDGIVRRGGAKLTPDRVGYMCHPDWVSRADRAPPADLWRPDIPTREGLTETANWYREQGWL